ncbi:unnamed protein product [Knipowitschia caucasica]|uniref:Uncharacterized protein n=1 Tax=Knipowitschia caucasica TaxID=637954 RepID=A0AAV2JRB3_KNICA
MAALGTAIIRISLKGAQFAPVRALRSHGALGQFSRPVYGSPAYFRPVHQSPPQSPPKQDPEASAEEVDEGPEYIPKRKAKNPMMKIGYAWIIGLPTGILTFIFAKQQVDKNRLKQLKIRQRMRQSNDGDFEGSRYQRHTGS